MHGSCDPPKGLALGVAGLRSARSSSSSSSVSSLGVLFAGVPLIGVLARRAPKGFPGLAPLLQESASKSHLGHPLSLALYAVVPLVFLVKLLTTHGSRPRRRWFDTVPALYALFIVASLVFGS